MPSSSLRTLTCVSVAFLIAASCSSCSAFYDTDKFEDQAAKGGRADAGDNDGGESTPDASTGERDAGPADCGPEGQSCDEGDPFFECNAEGECAECGREENQPCCLTAPRCDEGILGGLVCVNNLCAL